MKYLPICALVLTTACAHNHLTPVVTPAPVRVDVVLEREIAPIIEAVPAQPEELPTLTLPSAPLWPVGGAVPSLRQRVRARLHRHHPSHPVVVVPAPAPVPTVDVPVVEPVVVLPPVEEPNDNILPGLVFVVVIMLWAALLLALNRDEDEDDYL